MGVVYVPGAIQEKLEPMLLCCRNGARVSPFTNVLRTYPVSEKNTDIPRAPYLYTEFAVLYILRVFYIPSILCILCLLHSLYLEHSLCFMHSQCLLHSL